MSKVRDLEQLKERAERMRRESDKAQGALEESQKRLKEEFDVESLEEADKLLKKLEKEETTAKVAYETALEEFEEKWGNELG